MREKRAGDPRAELGKRGEELAAAMLVRQGYQIVERNWHCRAGEVDIVACRGNSWYFFEVRTRRGDNFGTPEESLSAAKLERMLQVALTYLADHGIDPNDTDWSTGLVAIEMDRTGRVLRVEVYESVT